MVRKMTAQVLIITKWSHVINIYEWTPTLLLMKYQTDKIDKYVKNKVKIVLYYNLNQYKNKHICNKETGKLIIY